MEDLHEGFENLYGRKETLDKKAKKLIDMERKMSGFSKDDDLLDASWDEKLSKFYKAMDWDDQGTPEE
jgi:predicted metal-dependent hydrolase